MIIIEKERIEGLRKGSIDDFNFLYTQYAHLLYSFSFKLLKSESDAKDIVQDTFMKIWVKREEISTEYSFGSYLYTIAKNKILTSFKQRIKEINVNDLSDFLTENVVSDMDIEQHLINQELEVRLQQSVIHLPPLQAKIFLMNKEEELSTQEISNRLRIPHQTVKNNLTKAMKAIREELKKVRIFFLFLNF